MIAVDTNVVVRFLVKDDPDQAQRARALIEVETVFVPTSVLLEAEWVLRSAYRLQHQAVVAGLRGFLRLPSVFAQDQEATFAALDWAEQGMDFADALHLASAASCEAFASFDRSLERTARKVGAMRVWTP